MRRDCLLKWNIPGPNVSRIINEITGEIGFVEFNLESMCSMFFRTNKPGEIETHKVTNPFNMVYYQSYYVTTKASAQRAELFYPH